VYAAQTEGVSEGRSCTGARAAKREVRVVARGRSSNQATIRSIFEFISFYGIWYDTPLTSRSSDRRHHPWPVYGLLMYSLAPRSSWI
jgi:hypothetical protein